MIRFPALLVAAAMAAASLSTLSLAATKTNLNGIPGSQVEPQSPLGTRLGSSMLWAVIAADGAMARSDGALRSAKLGTGQYEVIFARNLTACAFIATIGTTGFVGAAGPGEIDVSGRDATTNGVFIATRDSTGNFADRSFHLFVNC